jgi:hypothetical protein
MAVVLFALPSSLQTIGHFAKPRPVLRPEWMPEGNGGWPLYFAPLGFINNRAFGGWFLLGLIMDVALRLVPATTGFWR